VRVELPDDGWAVLYAPRKVRERSRRRYMAAIADLNAAVSKLPQIPNPDADGPATVPDPAGFDAAATAMTERVVDALILCLAKEWSFGPVEAAVLEEFDAETYDRLSAACRPFQSELLPDYSPDVDPKARTSGSPVPPPGPTFEIPSFAPTS
jgi:hypothetical protein